uniref:MOSC domain-containing protein n=1 Tax=Panagrellus redivivus TaxID=6233 RepID=A0A7E4VND3_PANRE
MKRQQLRHIPNQFVSQGEFAGGLGVVKQDIALTERHNVFRERLAVFESPKGFSGTIDNVIGQAIYLGVM